MAQKLLLIQDVEDLGRSGDILSVKPGHARNRLLPKRLAVAATAGTLRLREKLREERVKRAAADKKESEEFAAKLDGVVITAQVKVDPDGHMYGSVSTQDVVRLLEEQENLVVEKRGVLLKHPIKELGVHTIPLKLKEGVAAEFTLKIISQEVDGNSAPVGTED